MKDSFHFDIVVQAYKISRETVRIRARKLGIAGSYVTNEQAFDIANFRHKPIITNVPKYTETLIMPSKGNYITIENLPDWPTN